MLNEIHRALVDMGGTDPANDIRHGHHRLTLRLRALRISVVAALNGFTLGAVFDLALAADFRIAAGDAELGDVPAQTGALRDERRRVLAATDGRCSACDRDPPRRADPRAARPRARARESRRAGGARGRPRFTGR
jgi:hypothetical protein